MHTGDRLPQSQCRCTNVYYIFNCLKYVNRKIKGTYFIIVSNVMKNILNESSQNIVIEWTTIYFLLRIPSVSDATIKYTHRIQK